MLIEDLSLLQALNPRPGDATRTVCVQSVVGEISVKWTELGCVTFEISIFNSNV